MRSTDNKMRPRSASSMTSMQSFDSGAQWVLDRETRKASWEDVKAIAANDNNVEHMFASVAPRPGTTGDIMRPASRSEDVRPLTGTKKTRKKDPKFDSVHPQFGKSPYLMPILTKPLDSYGTDPNGLREKAKPKPKPRPKSRSSPKFGDRPVARASTAPAATGGSANASVSSSDSLSHFNSLMNHEQSNLHMAETQAMPFKKLLDHHASSRPTDAFINSKANQTRTVAGTTADAGTSSLLADEKLRVGVPTQETDPLYEIMRSNKFEMLRFAMHFAEEKGYLSGNSRNHDGWVEYFEHHLGISHNKDGDFREYDAIYDQYVSNSKKLVSDRVSGCGRTFRTTEYFPGQKKRVPDWRREGDDIATGDRNAATAEDNTGAPPTAPFPIEEFIIISAQEVVQLAEFNTPPIEIWATLKVVMYLFSSYHSHTSMLEQERINQENQSYGTNKLELVRAQSEKIEPIQESRSRLTSMDSFEEDIMDEAERHRRVEMRNEIKKVSVLLKQTKKTDSFMGKLDLDTEVKNERLLKVRGSGSDSDTMSPAGSQRSRGGFSSRNLHSSSSSRAFSPQRSGRMKSAGTPVSKPGTPMTRGATPQQQQQRDVNSFPTAATMVSLLLPSDRVVSTASDRVVPEHKMLATYTDHSKGLTSPAGMGSPKPSSAAGCKTSGKVDSAFDHGVKEGVMTEKGVAAVRAQLELPAVAAAPKNDAMTSYWEEFVRMKKLTTDPVTPSLSANNAFVSGMKVLNAESGDMQTRSYAKVVGERINRNKFYNKSPLTIQFENDEIEKAHSQKAAISVSMLANASVEFSWEAFRQFIRKFPTEFCTSLADILKDEDFFLRFPEGLLSELRHLVSSQLFQPIKLLAMKCKTGAKLCLWCRRAIALLYDGHLHAIRTAAPNVAAETMCPKLPLKPDPSKLGPSTSTSLFQMHGLSGTSSKDKLSRIVNYHVPNKPRSAVSATTKDGATTAGVEDESHGSMHVREPMKLCVEVMPSAFSSNGNSYATDVAPTPGSLLAFNVALDLIRPMDSLQLVAVKNTGITKYQREVRLYALLQHLRSGLASPGDQLLEKLKTREDVEVFEKREIVCVFGDLVARFAADHGGMLSPTFSTIALPPQRQKKVAMRFPAALAPTAEDPRILSSGSVDSDAPVHNDAGDLALNYEPHGAVSFGASKHGLGSAGDGFVVVGYDYEERPTDQMSTPSKSRRDGYRASLMEVGYGWVHRHGVLRYELD